MKKVVFAVMFLFLFMKPAYADEVNISYVRLNGIYYNPLAFYDLSSVPMLTSSSGGSVENVDFYSVGSLPSDFEGSYYEWLYYCDGYSGWD